MKEVLKKLIKVQQELKVGKDKSALGGRYHYRSAEDILAEVKPILKKHNCILTITDKVLHYEDSGSNISKGIDKFGKETTSKTSASRYYIVSTATLYDVDSGECIYVESNAREDTEKLGVDVAQLTGSATSYARKYAMGGLFLIDDNEKDVDEK